MPPEDDSSGGFFFKDDVSEWIISNEKNKMPMQMYVIVQGLKMLSEL